MQFPTYGVTSEAMSGVRCQTILRPALQFMNIYLAALSAEAVPFSDGLNAGTISLYLRTPRDRRCSLFFCTTSTHAAAHSRVG